MDMTRVISRSPQETRKVAAKFAKKLLGGDIVVLSGCLGAGKTEFVRGLAGGLGIKKPVQSPTFVLEKNYAFSRNSKQFTLRHLDLYRILKRVELEALQLKPPYDKNTIIIVEWPEKFTGANLKPRYRINFSLGKKPNERFLSIKTEKLAYKKRP